LPLKNLEDLILFLFVRKNIGSLRGKSKSFVLKFRRKHGEIMGLRYLTAGESHGRALCGILEGMPAGVEIEKSDFDLLLKKRRMGYGRGARMKIENDSVEVLSGIVDGKTIGSPIALMIKNHDYANHKGYMAPFSAQRCRGEIKVPLPGHADLPGALKYGFDDCRYIRERASARETAMRTALSVPARALLQELGIGVLAMVESIGSIKARIDYMADPASISELIELNGPGFLTPDSEVCEKWKTLIDECNEKNCSVGGVGVVMLWGLPAGLGSHVHYDRRLDGILGALLMSLPAVKKVEIGAGKELSEQIGNSCDEICFSDARGFYRTTNRAGGIEGGISNGEPLLLRFYAKALPGGAVEKSVNLKTFASGFPQSYRSDAVAIQAAAIAAESVVCLEIASQMIDYTGASNLETMQYRSGE
jgi:chorismate synthase